MKQSLLFCFAFAMLGINVACISQNVTYGFLQSPVNPLQITAVAYPDFNSNDVTISTATFSFLLPAGTVTDPAIVAPAPTTGAFNNITGIWDVQYLSPGLTSAELQGNDVYQVVLQNSPILNNVQSGVPIELFSFALPSDCIGGNVEVLTNDGTIQSSIFDATFANFNNSFDASVDNANSVDVYSLNNPATFSLPCPLDDVPIAMNDIASTFAPVPVNIPVLNNDDFGGNGPGIGPIRIITFPNSGIATVNTNGTANDPTDDTIDYTPNFGFIGEDVLTYQICDADNDCVTAEVSISVLNAEDPEEIPAMPLPYRLLFGGLLLSLGLMAASKFVS